MLEFNIKSAAAFESIIPEILEYKEGNKLFLLEGDLGAGKTTLVQAVGKYFKVHEQVLSPTFSIVNEYSFRKEGKDAVFYHLDLYRLNSIDEALNIGVEDYLYSGSYCFIEWPELITQLWPEELVKIKIEILADSTRKVIVL